MREKNFLREVDEIRLRVKRTRRILSFRKSRFQVSNHTRSRGGDRGMTIIPFKQRDLFTRRWRNVRISAPKEHELQIQIVQVLQLVLRQNVVCFHCPNGELRNKAAAAKLRAMGVKRGVSDLAFFWADPAKRFRALFLEIKRPGGKLTTEQAAFGLMMRTLGADFDVAYSIDEAIEAVGTRGLIESGIEICGKKW